MVLVRGTDKVASLTVTGKLGYTAGVGLARAGYSKCGSSKQYGGIYQRKKTLAGWATSRMRYYNPSNPQTTAQQAWRAVFSAGWEAYALLTTDEKMQLSKEARHYRLSGPQLFLKRYLESHRT